MINALKSDFSGEFFELNKNLLAKQVPHLHGAGLMMMITIMMLILIMMVTLL